MPQATDKLEESFVQNVKEHVLNGSAKEDSVSDLVDQTTLGRTKF
jgi:hypothetical protein